ncbi:hypothetical protein HPB47_021100 [Ixodes persulcatus]|uniref:Uncharacterized protein n=1 Tax=Ixodes persulcatus TaxID=34615 RepID=A0AC60QDH8_IXOPE|nr:hypothetical protein HPB47_021100 [Ixodes persulcatus]
MPLVGLAHKTPKFDLELSAVQDSNIPLGLDVLSSSTPPPTTAPSSGNKELDQITEEMKTLQMQGQGDPGAGDHPGEADLKTKNCELRNLETEMEAVSAMLRQLDSQKKEAQKRLAELSVQKAALDRDLTETRQELEEEKRKVSTLKQQLEEQTKLLEEQEKELEQKRAELKGLCQEECGLQAEIDSKKALLLSLGQTQQDTQLQISQVKAKQVALEEQHVQLKTWVSQVDRALQAGDPGLVPESLLRDDQFLAGLPEPEYQQLSNTDGSSHSSFVSVPEEEIKDDPFKSKDPFSDMNGFMGDPFAGEDPFKAADPFKSGAVDDPFAGDPFKSAFGSEPKAAKAMSATICAEAAAIVKDVYKELDPTFTGNITVVYDGSWKKRGHSSRIGVGTVIEYYTGLVLDSAVLSDFCLGCETGPKPGDATYQDWKEEHECQQNTTVKAGRMEVQAALLLFRRSLSLHGLRYTTIVSDGDCRTHQALCQDNVYGLFPITKGECVNHVAKRMGSALRGLVEKNKTQQPMGGKGRLTQDLIKRLTNYYSWALKSNASKVEDMQQAIMATFHHVASTDEDPQHDLCPSGKDSWCAHRRAEGKAPPPHKYKLPPHVTTAMFPVYRRLSDPELLQRCTGAKTQNSAESLHSVISSLLEKEEHASLFTVETGVADAVCRFNTGCARSAQELSEELDLKRVAVKDPFDPFGLGKPVTEETNVTADTDPFGTDPFAPASTAAPRPESPTPALPPKKGKNPPPRPAPPKHLAGSGGPVPPTGPTRAAPAPPLPDDPFASTGGGSAAESFANFADFGDC